MKQPTLHKPIPMNTRVTLPECYGVPDKGTVVGVSNPSLAFSYIVLLDEPFENDFGLVSAIAVFGTQLRDLEGGDWLL